MPIIIDTDAGHDDALAILLMLYAFPNDIACITAVAGNATIDKVSRNIAAILQLANRQDIPVFIGASAPLIRPLVVARVHGESGLDGIDVSNVHIANKGDAVAQIVKLINQHPNQIDILTLGPLTNVAHALALDPSIENKIKSLVVMGGAIDTCGNKSRVAEFNIYVDPEAADIVFKAQTPKVLVPLDPCDKIVIPLDLFEELKGSRLYTEISSLMKHFVSGINEFLGVNGALVYDALAAYYLIKPADYTLENMDVVVETKGEHTFGMTIAEKRQAVEKKIKYSSSTQY